MRIRCKAWPFGLSESHRRVGCHFAFESVASIDAEVFFLLSLGIGVPIRVRVRVSSSGFRILCSVEVSFWLNRQGRRSPMSPISSSFRTLLLPKTTKNQGVLIPYQLKLLAGVLNILVILFTALATWLFWRLAVKLTRNANVKRELGNFPISPNAACRAIHRSSCGSSAVLV